MRFKLDSAIAVLKSGTTLATGLLIAAAMAPLPARADYPERTVRIPAVVALLNRHANEVIKTKEVQQALLAMGIEPEGSSSADALAYFQAQRERITKLARELDVSFKN